MFQFLRKIHARIIRQRETPDELGGLDRHLNPGMLRLRAVDPETGRQWQRLREMVVNERRTEKAHRTSGTVSWARPAISFAVVAILFVVIGLFLLNQDSSVTYQTARGQQSTITLSDSSEVTLNHTSELIVERRAFHGARQVTLRGEAFFRVRRNGEPFTVVTDIATIHVLGTEFNIRQRGSRLEVAVISGSVNVSVRKNGRDSTLVLAKEQLTTCIQGEFPTAAVLLPFSGYPGWIHGKFFFYRTNLQSVCEEMQEQFDVTIRIENPRLLHETLTGAVDGRNLEAALSTLARLTGINYRHEKNGYTFY